MTRERRGWMWGKQDVPMYDYIWNRLEKKRQQNKHVPLLDDIEIPEQTEEPQIQENKNKPMKENYM